MIYRLDPGEEFEITKNGEYRIQVGDQEPVVLTVMVKRTPRFPLPEPEDFPFPHVEKVYIRDLEG